MSNNIDEIARLTIALLLDSPETGINLRISTASKTVVIAEEDLSKSVHEAATWRCPAVRPTIDLRVRAWLEADMVKAEIHRITGIAQHPANPDPYDVLARIESASFALATMRLGHELRRAVPADAKLGIDELMPQDRVFERAHVLSDQALKNGRDEELNSFLDRTIDSALRCHEGEQPASQFSLWLYPRVKHGWEILVQVKRVDDSYAVLVQDRIVADNFISRGRGFTQDEVKIFLKDYFSRMHAFKFSELRVYRSCGHTR